MGGKRKLIGPRRKMAYEMLHKVCRILDKEGIPYVLEAGTLLGVIREDRLLPWDTDVDLTITSEHIDQLDQLAEKINEAGYRVRIRTHATDLGPFTRGSPRIMKIQTRKWLFFKGYSLLDIFVKYQSGDRYYWMIDDKNPVLKSCPASFYDNRIPYEFDGKLFTVPAEYMKYLEYHYGKNWREPIKEWDYRLDDHCEKVLLTRDTKQENIFKRLIYKKPN